MKSLSSADVALSKGLIPGRWEALLALKVAWPRVQRQPEGMAWSLWRTAVRSYNNQHWTVAVWTATIISN